VLQDRVEVTTRAGELLVIDLASGALTRGPGRFAHLRSLVTGDLAFLARAEYEGRASGHHVRCTWKAGLTACEFLDEAGRVAATTTQAVPRTELLGRLAAIEPLLPALQVEPPTCFHVVREGDRVKDIDFHHRWLLNCGAPVTKPIDGESCCPAWAQRFRLIFSRPDGETTYDLHLDPDARREPETVRPAFRAFLRRLRFDDGGTLTDR
jgi:hypothetical protein